jgi:hypothetical protein
VRETATRVGWSRAAEAGVVAASDADEILDHHRQLQQLEWSLRRDQNRAVSVIPEPSDDQRALAIWLGAPDWPTYWNGHCRRLGQTREAVIRALTGIVPSTTLETDR